MRDRGFRIRAYGKRQRPAKMPAPCSLAAHRRIHMYGDLSSDSVSNSKTTLQEDHYVSLDRNSNSGSQHCAYRQSRRQHDKIPNTVGAHHEADGSYKRCEAEIFSLNLH
jgi:hypothetical protein